MLNVLLKTEATEFDGVAEEWPLLAERSRNIFSTLEWTNTWWRHYSTGREQRTFACRATDGRLVAIVPLARSTIRGLRALRFCGHGPGDLLAPVCAESDHEPALAGLGAALRSMDDWDVFVGERMLGEWGVAQALSARPLRTEGNPALAIGGRGWDDILAERSANFRSQVRRRERRIERELGLRFRLTSSAEDLSRDMDLLFALHAARWGASATRFSVARHFHLSFAAEALERGWLRLWIAEAGGRPAAAWYGFRYAGVESFYQSGRDPAFDPWSIGFVLLSHSIRAAAEDGMEEYRFLRGGEGYKNRFANVNRWLQTVARGRTPAGHAAVRLASSAGNRPRGRRLLAGLS